MTCNVADTRFTCEGIGPPFWCAMRSRSVVITGCRSPSPGFEMNRAAPSGGLGDMSCPEVSGAGSSERREGGDGPEPDRARQRTSVHRTPRDHGSGDRRSADAGSRTYRLRLGEAQRRGGLTKR